MAIQEFQNEQANALKTQALLDQQEKNFYSYAEKTIAGWQGEGKNVKPLIMELKNYKKRVVWLFFHIIHTIHTWNAFKHLSEF